MLTFSHVVGVLSVGVRMVVRVNVANMQVKQVKVAAMMMVMIMWMVWRMTSLRGAMMRTTRVWRMTCLHGMMMMRMEMAVVGKVQVEVKIVAQV